MNDKIYGCQCEWCKWYHHFKQHMINVPEESKHFFNDMADTLVNCQEQLSYADAIIDGQWPDADKVIESRRKKHKTHIMSTHLSSDIA